MSLSDTRVKTAKPGEKLYKIYDAEGLYIEVPTNGSKRWRFKYRFNGKEKRISLGLYPEVSLKEAREKRDAARKQVAAGIDPSGKGKSGRDEGVTFAHIAEEWLALNTPAWAPRHTQTVKQRLGANLLPYLGNKVAKTITPREVLDALRIVEKRGAPHAAKKTLGICSLIFRFGVASEYVDSDPCRDLAGALAPAPRGHFAAITDKEGAGRVMLAIDAYTGSAMVRLALKFQALTFVRPGELRGAVWEEISVNEALWSIPAARMKGRLDHLVPLSRQALAVLEEARSISGSRHFVFQSMRARADVALSENTLLMAIRAMGYDREAMTPHGFRAMASSLLNEMGWRPDVIERQLAHVEKDKVRAAYHRTDYIKERREMMQAWADFLDLQKEKAKSR